MFKFYFNCFLFLIISILTISSDARAQAVGKNVKDYLRLIPANYFTVFCCDGDVDKFVKKYASIEDNENLYLKADDTEKDPKYAGLILKVFKAPMGKTFVGLYSHSLYWDDYYFLEQRGNKLVNVSKTIPKYSLDNIYEFPRKGETIGVYQKKFDSPQKKLDADNAVTRGKKLYDLIWHNGRFAIKK